MFKVLGMFREAGESAILVKDYKGAEEAFLKAKAYLKLIECLEKDQKPNFQEKIISILMQKKTHIDSKVVERLFVKYTP